MLNREHVYPTSEESRADPKASIARTREIGEERDYIDDWRKGLQANTDRFTTLLNKDSANTAYMTKINGKTKLVVSQPIAERIVYNDDLENRNKVYTNDVETAERDDGRVIRHEYVHTQGGVGLPGLLIGINAEERRAEYFSGDRMGYQDIKYFFRDVRFTTGFSITDFFDKNVKGGTTEGLFAALSAEVGLDMMPEIMMMPPTNYLESQTNSVKQEIVDHLGSFSGVIGRLIGRAEKDPDMAKAMDARIQEYAQVLADSTIDDEAFNDYVIPGNRRNGSVYFIDDIAQRSAAIRAARGQKVPIPV